MIMWCLPDINAMNARAAANAKKLMRAAGRRPNKKQKCEVYGCGQPAVESVPWFDIFSDDPKGLVHVCGECRPDAVEGFFTCEGCQRLMADHISWERYQVELDGQTLCLACAAKRYFATAENWIDPAQVRAVVLDRRGSVLFEPETGILNVSRCRHVLGVKQPEPAGIKYFDNFEFDSEDGRQISGGEMLTRIQELVEPFCPVMDGAYQFSVSIGIYVRDGDDQHQELEAA